MLLSPVKLRKLWRIIGMLLIVLVIFLSLIPDVTDTDVSHGDKIGHLLAYFTLMLWHAQIYPASRWHRIAAAFVLLGIVLEVMQGQTGYRVFSFADMLANIVGVIGGWIAARAGLSQILRHLEHRLEISGQ